MDGMYRSRWTSHLKCGVHGGGKLWRVGFHPCPDRVRGGKYWVEVSVAGTTFPGTATQYTDLGGWWVPVGSTRREIEAQWRALYELVRAGVSTFEEVFPRWS